MNTYQVTLKKGIGTGRTLSLKLKKDTAGRVVSEIKQCLDLADGSHWKELTGVLGQEEHSTILWSMFGGSSARVTDPQAYESACLEFLNSLPELITESNVAGIITTARAIFATHLPIVDKRVTPEVQKQVIQERAQQNADAESKRKAERDAMLSQYAESNSPVDTPAGKMAVVLQLHFNDSDMMTDYFDRNHPHGPVYVLGYVPDKTPRREASMRAWIERYPQLARLTWKFEKEEYSMGHGTWLESEKVTTLDGVKTYGHTENPSAWWEVTFRNPRHDVLYPFAGFTAANSPAAPRTASSNETTPADGSLYTVTYERDWTWVKFPAGRPADSILDCIRPHAHWGNKRQAWYITRHADESEIASWFAPVVSSQSPLLVEA